MTLPSNLRQEIVNFLTNFFSFHSENGRKANLLNAGLDKQIPAIDLSGSTTEFVARLVEQLAQYGSLPGRDQALVCLLQSLESQVGLEKQNYIKTLCQRLTTQQTAIIENCPYRGLFAFREEDERFFFGRDAYTQKLIAAVQSRPLVAVIGASGSGKSSVVYAGVFPELRREGNWLISSFRPGDNPFQAIAKSLIPFLYSDELERLSQTKRLAEQLRASEISLSDVIVRIIEKDGQAAKFLLFADQFEELYTPNQNDDDRRRFLDEFLASSGGQTSVCKIILTLRADFLGKTLAYRPFADALQETDIKLGPMNRDELRETIEQPAKALDVEIEDGLTDRILDAVGDEPGNLPLLEFALTELWNRQTNGLLTHAAYEAIGGVEQALAAYAENVYTNLFEDEQTRAQRIFTQLVRPGEGTEDTRRVATRADVGEENWELITKLADKRLVVTGRSQETVETVEVVHEALIQRWQRLREWMDADRQFLMWQERLRQAQQEWEKTNKDEGSLLRGARLAEAEEKLKEYREELNPHEKTYIKLSIALHEREIKGRERARQEQERFQKRINRNLKLFLAVAIGLLILIGWEWQQSVKMRKLAEQHQLNAQNQAREAQQQRKFAEKARQEAEKNLRITQQKIKELELVFNITNAGVLYGSLNKYHYQRLVEVYQHSLSTNRKNFDDKGQSNDLTRIGIVYQHIGEYQKALKCFQESLEIHLRIGDLDGKSRDLSCIGQVYHYLSQYRIALEYYQQALHINDQLNNLQEKGKNLSFMGITYQKLGEYEYALNFHKNALTIRNEIDDLWGESTDLANIGQINLFRGQYQTALENCQQSLDIRQNIGDRRGKAETLSILGEIHLALLKNQEALELYKQALLIRRELNDKYGEAIDLSGIGRVYDRFKLYDEALTYHQDALNIRREIGDLHGQIKALTEIVEIYKSSGKPEKAQICQKEIENMLTRLNVKNDLGPMQYLSLLEERSSVSKKLDVKSEITSIQYSLIPLKFDSIKREPVESKQSLKLKFESIIGH